MRARTRREPTARWLVVMAIASGKKNMRFELRSLMRKSLQCLVNRNSSDSFLEYGEYLSREKDNDQLSLIIEPENWVEPTTAEPRGVR